MQVSSLDSDFEEGSVQHLSSCPESPEEQNNKDSDLEQQLSTETEEESDIKMHFVPQGPSTSHSKEIKYDIFKEFNSRNAKIIACSIVCGFVLYHSFLRVSHGMVVEKLIFLLGISI